MLHLLLQAEYWIDVARQVNDDSAIFDIDVGNQIVNLYLRSNLSSAYRVRWLATKLRERFRVLRSEYESSSAYRRFNQSGQNGNNFYPDFQTQNPSHVMCHYMLQQMPRGGVLGDLPKHALVDTEVEDFTPTPLTPTGKSRHAQLAKSRRHQRFRSPSPAPSETSLASSSPSLSSASVSGAVGTFNHACMSFINAMKTQRQVQRGVCDASAESLRLLDQKKKIKSRLRELDEADEDDDEDDRALLLLNLRALSQRIKALLGS